MRAAEQAELLQKADRGLLPCPDCGSPLRAALTVSTTPDVYEGVVLFCMDRECGFYEW